MEADISANGQRIEEASASLYRVREEIGKVIVGQRYLVETAADRPAGRRPRAARRRAGPGQDARRSRPWRSTIRRRVPAHPVHARSAARRPDRHADLQPARRRRSRRKKGPIFANIILADEINRAPAKVQTALLEAMQERQVTIGDETYPLPEPFLVLATQNPIEQEGTYPLPEAQVDRFMLKLVRRLSRRASEERQILDRMARRRRRADRRRSVDAERRSLAARAARRRDLHRRQDQGVHRRPRARHARSARASGCDLAADSIAVRRLAARDDLPDARRQGARLPATAAATSPRRTSRRSALDVLRHRVIVTYEAEAEEVDVARTCVRRDLRRRPVP